MGRSIRGGASPYRRIVDAELLATGVDREDRIVIEPLQSEPDARNAAEVGESASLRGMAT